MATMAGGKSGKGGATMAGGKPPVGPTTMRTTGSGNTQRTRSTNSTARTYGQGARYTSRGRVK